MPKGKMRSLLLLLLAIFVSVPAMAREGAPPWWHSLSPGPGVLAVLPQAPATTPAAHGKTGRLSPEGEWIGAFFLPADDPMTLYLDGHIEEGAALDFERALARRPDTDLVYLVSGGGRVDEALLIATQIARADIATAVPTGRRCYSACAFVFFAGSTRAAHGLVGVHQISGPDLDVSSALVSLAGVLDVLSAFNVSQRVISAMLRTPPNGIHILDQEELRSIDADPGSHMNGFTGILDGTAERAQAF
jgi:hypothetical protein